MKKVILVLVLSAVILFGQDNGWLTTDVQHDTVTISHIQTQRNCGSRYIWEAEIDGNQILLIERDTSTTMYHCLCYYDLSVTLGSLPPGDYHTEVIGLDYMVAETLYFGGIDFTIGQQIGLLEMTNSGCLGGLGKKSAFATKGSIEVNVSADSLILLWHTPDINCGFQPLWSGWLSADTFFVTVSDTGQPADCLCLFDQTAAFGPFQPGNYILACQPEEYGYYNFTIASLKKTTSNYVISYSQSDCYAVKITSEKSSIPTKYTLCDNYPNPFNPETTIQYDLPEIVHVRLEIYDLLGQRIATLVDSRKLAGKYTQIWDSKDQRGNVVASGIYFYKLTAGDFVRVKKMVLMR